VGKVTPEISPRNGSKFSPLTAISFAELNLMAATTSKKNANAFEHALHYANTGTPHIHKNPLHTHILNI
jgi:hypothetical protein